MDWTDQAIEQLRALWAEGHSTAEIGRRMGVTKNAIVGKAHRLDLPSRPSPIRRDAVATPRRLTPRRAPSAPRPMGFPPMARLGGMPVTPAQGMAGPRPSAAPSRPATPMAVTAPAPSVPIVASAVVRPFPRAAGRSCCWPLGEPGAPGFRFCEGGALPGKPYCPEHAAVAYVKARDRREDAA